MFDLPAPLRLASPFPFVGRASELQALNALVPHADGEGRRMALLGGEPGSGKSRLVREFAARAATEGALVLYGACDAVVPTPYGPFIEALEPLARTLDVPELRDVLARGSGGLARILPDLAAELGDAPQAVAVDPDTERHRLHTVVADLLALASRHQPVLLIIEDGHWADGSSLFLLRDLARRATAARLLVLATFRDTEAEIPRALGQTLADLRRADDVVRLRLGSLSGDDVSEFVQRAGRLRAGSEVAELAVAMEQLTGGNAFLLCELWRALVETGSISPAEGVSRVPLDELGTPESVREVVSQRLARLAPTTAAILNLAATAGAEFELDIVRRACGLPAADVLGGLDEAVRSGFLEELRGHRLTYRFTHELVRRAVYDRLTALRRAELHLRIGEAQEVGGHLSMRTLTDLAHHFEAAAALGETERAIDYSIRAGHAASEALAFDEAAGRFRAALELGVRDDLRRAEVLIGLGIASHRAGRVLDAVSALGSAADVARRIGDGELLARAAIGYEDAGWRPQEVAPDTIGLLEEATLAIGDRAPALRLRLLSGLARALDLSGEHPRAAEARRDAIALAQETDDRYGLATVLARSYWALGATPMHEVLGMLTEAKRIGEDLGETEIRAEAMAWRAATFVVLGEIPAARAEALALREISEGTGQPFMLHVAEQFGSALALSDGRLADAEVMAQRSYEAGRLLTGRDASGTYGIQMFNLRREQGRLFELAPVVRLLAAGNGVRQWQPGLVALLVELGMEDEARAQLARITADGLEPFQGSIWLASLTYLAEACAALGDESLAALLYPELRSGAGIMIGNLVAFLGAADRYLGMLARTLGDWERAEVHFEQALVLNRRLEAPTWLAHTQVEYAEMLLARGIRERARAAALLNDAYLLAEEIGMRGLLARIERLSIPAARTPVAAGGLSPREQQILGLVAQGLTNREIGARLFISEHTTANHMRSILRKTGCANRTEAASYAHRHEIIDAVPRT